MCRVFLSSFILFLLGVSELSAQESKPSIKVYGLDVGKPLPREITESYQLNRRGTGLTFVVTVPEKAILGVVENKSELLSFTDDQKTDLKGNIAQRPWLRFYAGARTLSEHCQFGIEVSNAPAAGATKLFVKAKLAVQIGSGEKIGEAKDFELKKDAKTQVGTFNITKPASMPDNVVEVSFNEFSYKKVAFFDTDGNEIKCRNSGTGSGPPSEAYRHKIYLMLERKVEKVTVRLTYYEKVEILIVPLDQEVGLGL